MLLYRIMKMFPSWLASISIHLTLILLLTFTTSAFFKQRYEGAKALPVYEAYISLSRGNGGGQADNSPQFPHSNVQDSVEDDITFAKVELTPESENGDRHLFSSGSADLDIGSDIGAGSLSKLSQGKSGSRPHAATKNSKMSGGGSGGGSATHIGLAGVNPPPPYPDTARRNGWEGLVLLIVKVSPDGRAKAVEVKESSGYDILDKSASDTIAKWLFQPARQNDIPVEGVVEVPIRFKLKQ